MDVNKIHGTDIFRETFIDFSCIIIAYPTSSNFCKKRFFLQKLLEYNWLLLALQFSVFLTSSFMALQFSIFIVAFLFKISYLISTEKWSKKGKYSNGVQIFAFLLENRFVWRQRFQIRQMEFDQKMCLKRTWCCSYHG